MRGAAALGVLVCLGATVFDTVAVTVFEAPVTQEFPRIEGTQAILVNGRRVTPAGEVFLTQSYNWGMAVSRDERRVALINPDAIEVIDLHGPVRSRRFPPHGQLRPKEFGKGGYMGIAFSPDAERVYFGNADGGEIKMLDLSAGRVLDTWTLDGDGVMDSFVGDFQLDPSGLQLIVVDQHNYRLVVLDLGSRQVVRSVRVGRSPFSVALAADGRHAWVSNVGMFEYPLLPGVTSSNRATAGLSFPAYGVPSEEAERGVTIDGRQIPGLGSPNHPDAMSVFKVNLASGQVEKRVKTGYLVGVERDDIRTVGGASPAAVAAGKRHVYVSNATNDSISIIDPETGEHVAQIHLYVPGLRRWRGVMPFGLCLSPDEQRLYVACAGLNAVAVVDTRRRRLEGYLPAGWFCSAVQVSADGGRLFVVSAKGLGSGPNGGNGFIAPVRGTHPGDIMQGTLQIVPVPTTAGLRESTRRVVENTYQKRRLEPARGGALPENSRAGRGPIKHVVFIVKENRTFDQVFGQRSGVRGDPTLTTLGWKMNIRSQDGARRLEGVDVSPNHQALADAFAISDNFYCEADQSNTGHRWLAGVYPNEWVEVNARSHIEERLFSTAPGRRYVSGASGVVNPEDFNEAGALWEHLARHRVPFFNFGFGTEMPASIEDQLQKFTGVRMSVSFPLPRPLFENTSRTFACYNMAIPDQFRVDMFEEEFRDKWESGREPFPRLITMVLPNDHMSGERPADGYPFRESYFGDNDIALGRVIQTLSHSRWWKDMLVVVTEDDPQGGRDHVDAHRSILMLIGPHVKRGYVSHMLTSFGSVMRLLFTLLGMPPLNQYDATATLPRDMFAAVPDFTPYQLRTIDPRLFDPAKALKPFDRGFNWGALLESPEMDKLEDMRENFR
jgi:YVTN family beta-propeller protein